MMTSTGRVVLLSPPGAPVPPEIASIARLERCDSARELLSGVGGSRGVVLLHQDLKGAEISEVLIGLLDVESSWAPVLLAGSGAAASLWPVSLGYPLPVDLRRGEDDLESSAKILQLRSVLKDLRKARHDINNPLTSALAETQLLLMDISEGDERESLLQVQTQLRKIRDMVEELARFRPPEG